MKKKVQPLELERLEGICLKVINYQENDAIMSVFTPDRGVCHLIGKKNGLTKKWGQINAMPLMQAEFLYLKKSKTSTLLLCKEITLIKSFLFLRSDYSKLDAACKMSRMIYESQLPGNPAPLLYELFKRYLSRLEVCSETVNLILSFQFKCLRHEGIFGFPPKCEVCLNSLDEAFYLNSQFYCSDHRPSETFFFNNDEISQIAILSFSCDFNEICSFHPEERFVKKAQELIDDLKKFF